MNEHHQYDNNFLERIQEEKRAMAKKEEEME
jgi:hypothetical protein